MLLTLMNYGLPTTFTVLPYFLRALTAVDLNEASCSHALRGNVS